MRQSDASRIRPVSRVESSVNLAVESFSVVTRRSLPAQRATGWRRCHSIQFGVGVGFGFPFVVVGGLNNFRFVVVAFIVS